MTTSPVNRRAGFSGKTQNTIDNSAMLGAEFWSPGIKLACIYNRDFATKYGQGHEFMLVIPQFVYIKIDQYGHSSPVPADSPEAKKITRFAMPPLAGFDMAYQDMIANGFDGFRHGDKCLIQCVGIQKATSADYSDMPLFDISVDPR